MPLTIAHPVAVLPLRRCGLPLSALIVGSIAPDLEYVLRLAPRSEISHTASGLLLFCVPVGMAALWLFQRVWKRPIAAFLGVGLGDSISQASAAFTFSPFHRFAVPCAAILVGAMTHVGWDSFTHQYGWMVQRFPSLSRSVFQARWGIVPLYKVLQHGSTAMGLAVFALIETRFRAWKGRISVSAWAAMALIATTSSAAGICFAMLRMGIPHNLREAQRSVGVSLVAVETISIMEVTLLSLAGRFRMRKPEQLGGGYSPPAARPSKSTS
ncbi:MAG: DUF4184 family protein [Kiritimatiellae bacterium]|nr:DUF4184 family protein [Kiritimatiellia bacterium]